MSKMLTVEVLVGAGAGRKGEIRNCVQRKRGEMLLTRGIFTKLSFRGGNHLGVVDSKENVEDGSDKRLC